MKTNYIEQMSVADRNNSLSGYYNSLIKKYQTYYAQKPAPLEFKEVDKANDICCQVINSGYLSFAAILQRKENLEKRGGSDKVYTSEEYAAHKFALSKHLNLIQKIIYKLCYGSIDSSITEENTEIEDVKQAMTWLFVDCVNSKQPSYQDVERVKMILNKKSIVKQVGSVNDNGTLIYGDAITVRCGEFLNTTVSNNHTKQNPADIQAMIAYKEVIRHTLNDMFKVLSNLINFSQYLTVVEETAYPNMMHMMANNTFQTLEELKTKPNMEKILALAEGVKTLLIEYFSSFVKIKSISLPHSYLTAAEFSHSTITNGNFMSSDVTDANLSYASARDCDFTMCAMDDMVATHADFSGCNFNYASLIGVDFSNAILNDTSLNSIALLDNRILQRNLYALQPRDADSQISYAEADKKTLRPLFDSFVLNFDCENPDIRGKIINRLGKHYAGEGSLAHTMEISYSQERKQEYNCPYVIKSNTDCVLDGLDEYVREALDEYRTWCGAQFLHPKCLEWASNKSDSDAIKLSTANLESASVKNAVMPDCAFSIIKLQNASFQNTDLNNSTYYYTDARNAFFGDCNMTQTRAGYSDFHNATFNNSNLINAQFINCRLSETNFANALLIDSVIINTTGKLFFNDKTLTEVQNDKGTDTIVIRETDIAAKETEFCGRAAIAAADMQDADFTNCIANNVAIVGINMDRSIFFEANLKRGFIYNCLSRWTDYTSANLSYALLIGNTFGHSSIADANFTSARIFACDFSDCDMRTVNLINTRIDNTIFTNCDLEKANFSNTIFVNCFFKNLNMHGGNFTNCVFINCMFNSVAFDDKDTERNLFTASFQNCNFIDESTYKVLEDIKNARELEIGFLENCKTTKLN